MSENKRPNSEGNLRLPAGDTNDQWTSIQVNGQPVKARQGESLAMALWAEGIKTLRHSHVSGAPRGIFCGMGVCFDCLVTIDGMPKQRACLTPVQPGMQIETEDSWPSM